MPLLFVRDDLTQMHTDAIVCPTDAHFSAGGGTDKVIRRKAGWRLRLACLKLGTLQRGDVRRTDGYDLPCRHIFHVYGPVWQGGNAGETQTLTDCYRNVLDAAKDSGCESVAFPVLSAGRFCFPQDVALQTAVQAIRSSPHTADMTVYLVLYDETCTALAERYRYLRESFPPPRADAAPTLMRQASRKPPRFARREQETHDDACVFYEPTVAEACAAPSAPARSMSESLSLEELLRQPDESFSEMLLRVIDEKGMTDAECYKRANIDRKLFSKIRSNSHYKPSKATALAFAVALELPPQQTRELLQKAGYAFSRSSKFDIIVEYFIEQGQYDIFTINEALFAYDQALLC